MILYSSPLIRRHQFTGITDWTDGLYISPGLAGSRPGALIATAWASLVRFGHSGYIQATLEIVATARKLRDGLISSPLLSKHLEIIGDERHTMPNIVAFKSKHPSRLNIYDLNDLLSKRSGWHLSALQRPPALHICFTAAHGDGKVVESLLEAMEAVVEEMVSGPREGGRVKGGSAPLYGMAGKVPDRKLVAEFLETYQDVMLEV